MTLGSKGGPGEGILAQDFVFTQKKTRKKKKENPLSFAEISKETQCNPRVPVMPILVSFSGFGEHF